MFSLLAAAATAPKGQPDSDVTSLLMIILIAAVVCLVLMIASTRPGLPAVAQGRLPDAVAGGVLPPDRRRELIFDAVPAFLAHADLQAGRLVPLLPDVRLPPFGMVYAVYGERRLPLRTRLFLDLLQESIGSPPVWLRGGA